MESFECTTNIDLNYPLQKMSLYSQSMSTGDITRWTFGQFSFLLTWKWENVISTKFSFIKVPTEKGNDSGTTSRYYFQTPRLGIQRPK